MNPIITSVIEIDLYDETNLDTIRRNIYELERRGIQQKVAGVIRRYYANGSGIMHYREYLESGRSYYEERFGKDSSRETSTAEETKVNYSLKNSLPVSELLNTIEGVQQGDKKAVVQLSKHAKSGTISTQLYDEMIEKYGSIRPGENPSRDVSVPKRTAENKKVSQMVRTILEAKATPDKIVPNIEKLVEDGVFTPQFNKSSSYIRVSAFFMYR